MCWGFFRPKDQYVSEQYHQLLVRWFQFGVFTPIFRVHGAGTHTEIWNFGNETMKAINTSAITLRYRPGWSCHLSFLVSKYTIRYVPIWFNMIISWNIHLYVQYTLYTVVSSYIILIYFHWYWQHIILVYLTNICVPHQRLPNRIMSIW